MFKRKNSTENLLKKRNIYLELIEEFKPKQYVQMEKNEILSKLLNQVYDWFLSNEKLIEKEADYTMFQAEHDDLPKRVCRQVLHYKMVYEREMSSMASPLSDTEKVPELSPCPYKKPKLDHSPKVHAEIASYADYTLKIPCTNIESALEQLEKEDSLSVMPASKRVQFETCIENLINLAPPKTPRQFIKFVNCINLSNRFLRYIGHSSSLDSALMVYIISKKLPDQLKVCWDFDTSNYKDYPTFKEFLDFLQFQASMYKYIL